MFIPYHLFMTITTDQNMTGKQNNRVRGRYDDVIVSQFSINFVHSIEENPIFQLLESNKDKLLWFSG